MASHSRVSFKNAETIHDAQWLLNNLEYDAQQGELWMKQPRKKLSITEKASIFGAHIRLNGKSFVAMRVAWLMTFARWPLGHILPLNGWWHDIRSTNLFEIDPVDGEQEALTNLLPSTRRMMQVEVNKRYLRDLLAAGHKPGVGEQRWKAGIPKRIIPQAKLSLMGSSAGMCAEGGD